MMDTLHCELRVVGALLKRLLEEILESESSQKGSENKANEFAKLVSELTKNRGGFTISVEKGKIKKCSINNNNSGRAFVGTCHTITNDAIQPYIDWITLT